MRQSLKSRSAERENPFLIFALRKSTKIYKKENRSEWNGFHERAKHAENCASADALFYESFIETRAEHRVSKGDSAVCGTRLRALP